MGMFCTNWDTTFPTIPGISYSIFWPIIGKNGMIALLAFSFIVGRRDFTILSNNGYYFYNSCVFDCSLLEGGESLCGFGIIAIWP